MLKADNISKQYRLGLVGTGTFVGAGTGAGICGISCDISWADCINAALAAASCSGFNNGATGGGVHLT